MFKTKKEIVFVVLAGIFITNAVVAELIGGKLIQVGPFVMSIGILPWPVVFLTTDLINEYFGEKGVRKLSFITACLIAYAFVILIMAMIVPAAKGISPVNDEQFQVVFGQSMWIIVGSIIAFMVSQLIDVSVFWFFKNKTGDKKIWLRTTGSTVISQLFDSFIVLGIAFWLPGKINFDTFISSALTGYVFKLSVAVLLTPLIYVGHHLIKKYLDDNNSDKD
ncbi:queuosine precursor transporter [Flavobacterium sp. Fl-77]|uniref:Probable queuosine precursor transporter n=1 Tax=Flavobacterium flavipigmentatum TaxID=2893884 RepID=A0AAJ2SDE6_9FLAO|nr:MULTISPECIES: queuosine precursor transporter [unclassified Flavobacterium]MDX6183499.1 queuosine precursor transporter [Flavobacterium sp. Fl-33]MDX6187099.1 queuosine precursor transporter [Flavobacterium sp. Fl-77]UFH40169.1 queuosine precursor transporter [Flavobacterium sp. F-70]